MPADSFNRRNNITDMCNDTCNESCVDNENEVTKHKYARGDDQGVTASGEGEEFHGDVQGVNRGRKRKELDINTLSGKLLFGLIWTSILFSLLPNFSSAQNVDEREANSMLKGQVGAYETLGESELRALGIRSAVRSGNQLWVEHVEPGSAAFHANIKEGDRLLDARLAEDKAILSLDHEGRTYTAEIMRSTTDMPPVAPLLVPRQPQAAAVAKPSFTLNANKFDGGAGDQSTNNQPLKGGLTVADLKLLSTYNIELVVDRSNSMKKRDCPGGLSRWDWCGEQAAGLAKSLSPYVPNGLTITTFAFDHEVFPRSTPQKIVSIFNTPNFQLGTRLAEALDDRLSNYFIHRRPDSKPLLIVVITDGVPTPFPEPFMVRDALIGATKSMRDPREMTVAFLQIGGRDFRGQRFLANLDSNLVQDGAKYDIVHAKMFDTIQSVGLAQTLVQTIQESVDGHKPKLNPIDYSGISEPRYQRRMRRYGLAP